MKIKMAKSAEWGGKRHKSGSVVDAPDFIASKLIARGYAKIYVPDVEKEADAPAADK